MTGQFKTTMKTENEDKNSDNSKSGVNRSMDFGVKNTLNKTIPDVFIIDKGKEYSSPQMIILLVEYLREIVGFRLDP